MRILLKISWEALKWQKEFWIDPEYTMEVVEKIKQIYDRWVQIAIVIWWWNIYRWSNLIAAWVNAADSHNLSMLSTIFNWVVLKNFLEQVWIDSIVMDPNWVKFVESYSKDNAIKHLNNGKIVICTGGTWNPFFTTDTWWVLRAMELKCDFMIKATKVDWVYDKDPMKYNDAKFYEKISYEEVIAKNLKILDQTAISLARDNSLKIKVLNLSKKDSILRVLDWKNEGSEIS